jgi:tetratricopeptide (TPR) repeat protein
MQLKFARRLFRSPWPYLALSLAAVLLVGLVAATYLYEHDTRVRFRVQEAWSSLLNTIDPQEVIVPTPVVVAAAPTFAPTATATASPTVTATEPGPTSTPAPTATRTPSPTALPGQVTLTGFKHEYQLFNNCGPASLSVNLSYWGWTGDQRDAAAVVKPVQDDKNVSPRELYEFALTQGFDAYIRSNGDVDTLKRFLAAGYPVLVEKGYTCEQGDRCSDWFGHYSVVTAYDDTTETFTLQDTYLGPNLKLSYDEVMENWRAFNYLYVVLFPADPGHDAEVRSLLGEAVDLDKNYRSALTRAQQEAAGSTGDAAAFAWFNIGTNLYYLQDYAGAAAAFDQSRQIGLPYRMLWYQFGPYTSYYYMSRYEDVIELATFAIDSVNTVPGLEEAYYWRALSQRANGEFALAEEDLRTALARHPGWQPAIEALTEMGLTP